MAEAVWLSTLLYVDVQIACLAEEELQLSLRVGTFAEDEELRVGGPK